MTEAPAPSLGRSIAPLLLISFAMLVGFTMLQSFGIMAETAKAEMHLSDSALAVIQGVAAAIPLVLFSIPIGIWVDRWNRVAILILMAIGWTLGTFVTAAAPSPAILFIGRMLTAIGTTGGLTAVLSLASDYCRPEQRGKAIVIPNIAKTAGIAAGFAVAGLLLGAVAADRLPAVFGATPWRSAQWMLGIGSALCLLPLLLLREPERHEVEAGPSAPFRVVLAELSARRGWIIPLFVGQTTVVMADAAAGIWVSPVLERFYHQQPGEFAGWLGALVFTTGIVGSIVGGLVADIGQKSHVRGGLMVGAIAAALVGVPSALFPIMPGVGTVAIAIGSLMLAGSVTAMVASVALTVWLPNELRGLGIGAFIAVAGLIGFGIAPSLVTMVSGLLGGERHLNVALAIVGVTVSLISVVGFWLAMKRAPVGPTCQKGMD
ncbi:MAG: MFS transporter [Sphingomonas sp.]|nr:MFS transporter [Sphingomonas sp.]